MNTLETEIGPFISRQCGSSEETCKNSPQGRYTLYIEYCTCDECGSNETDVQWLKWNPCEGCFENKIEELALQYHFDNIHIFRYDQEVTHEFGFFSSSAEEESEKEIE